MSVPFNDLDAWIDSCTQEKDMVYEDLVARPDMPTDMMFTFLLKCGKLGTRPPTKSQRAELIKINPPVMTLLLLLISQYCNELSQDLILTNNLVRSFVGFTICHSQEQYLNIKEYVANVSPMAVLDFIDCCMKLGQFAVNTICFLVYPNCANAEIKRFCEDLVDPASIRWNKFYTHSLVTCSKIIPLIQNKASQVSPENWASMILNIMNHVTKVDHPGKTILADCVSHTFRFAHCSSDPTRFAQIVYNNAPQDFKVIMWGMITSGSYMDRTPFETIEPKKIKMWSPPITLHNVSLLIVATFVCSDFTHKKNFGKYLPALVESLSQDDKSAVVKHITNSIMSSHLSLLERSAQLKELGQVLIDASGSVN